MHQDLQYISACSQLWKLSVPADDGAGVLVNCLPIVPSSLQVISLLLQTVTLLEYTDMHKDFIVTVSTNFGSFFFLFLTFVCTHHYKRPNLSK